MKKIIYAFRFLTIIPIPWKENEDLNRVARSIIYFPLVGLFIGLLLFLSSIFLNKYISTISTASIITVVWIILTGGLHLDGLSDLFDGMGGNNTIDRLRIMKDSQIGVFGALSLICLIILKIVIYNEILLQGSLTLLYSIILSPIWGRVSELITIRFFKSAREEGLGNFFKREIKEIDWILPTVLTIILTIFLLNVYSLIIILFLVGFILFISKSISKKLNGLTGDCYGAICEITELMFLCLSLILFFVINK